MQPTPQDGVELKINNHSISGRFHRPKALLESLGLAASYKLLGGIENALGAYFEAQAGALFALFSLKR